MATTRDAGFTLLEVLVTLVIMALALALVAPRFGDALPGVELQAETRKVVAMLRHARSKAVLLNQDIQIQLVEEPAALSISTEDEPYRPPEHIRLELSAGRVSAAAEQPIIEVDQAIRFFAEGYSSGGSITLSREDGRRASIHVDWLTGRVSTDD